MEPYQKFVTNEHPKVKRTLIGLGGQKNSPPFTQKPSFKRNKSAPPVEAGMMGENSMEQKDPYEGLESMDMDRLLDEREYLQNRLDALEQRIIDIEESGFQQNGGLEEVYQPLHKIPPKAPQRLT